jgi:hypothetical protein
MMAAVLYGDAYINLKSWASSVGDRVAISEKMWWL